MGNIFVISDVHGTTSWKDMLKGRKSGDKAVFLGDYFDFRGRGPFAEDQAANFIEICAYAESNPNTFLLMGNHDLYYTPWALRDPYDPNPDPEGFEHAVMPRISMLEMVHVVRTGRKPLVFSHGGLTGTFLSNNNLEEPEQVNGLWREKPEIFEWIQNDPRSGFPSHLDGDNIWQSPLWVRTEALKEDGVRGYNQIVGHTPVSEVSVIRTQYGDSVLMTCSFNNEPVVITENFTGDFDGC